MNTPRTRIIFGVIALVASCAWLNPLFCDDSGDIIFSDDFKNGIKEDNWRINARDCEVSATNGRIHIHGTINDGTDKSFRCSTKNRLPADNFTASVKFRVPQFSGTGMRMIVLEANPAESETFGLFYKHETGYRVGWWGKPTKISSSRKPFRDEDETFHKMKLIYDAEKQKLTGYVDRRKVGTLRDITISGDIRYSLVIQRVAASTKPPSEVDIYFDDFEVRTFP